MKGAQIMSTYYNIGTGISEIKITSRKKLPMQGFADPSQWADGIETPLYSRAFIIQEIKTKKLVVIVSADIWAGTALITKNVIERLRHYGPKNTFNYENVLISGTHTHSAPGGYTQSILFDPEKKFYPQVFGSIYLAIYDSIIKAHKNLAPGKIYIYNGDVENCGENRSIEAYNNNPASERKKYKDSTDKEMLLLKFVKVDEKENEKPVGVLNWYAIHPTNRGQKNTKICGDNKGWASYLFEKEMKTNINAKETFVAAFANSNCGDVSGNVRNGKAYVPDGKSDKKNMETYGMRQYERAKKLFKSDMKEELTGNLDYQFKEIDISNIKIGGSNTKRTGAAAIGISFAAGSTEDGVPIVNLPIFGYTNMFKTFPTLREGMNKKTMTPEDEAMLYAIRASLLLNFGPDADIFSDIPEKLKNIHDPKPIILATGLINHNPPLTPSIVPLQIFKIGQFAITAIPGEMTTMAGRRLKQTVLSELNKKLKPKQTFKHLALATYANEYTLYITTREEYEMQHYEGASNLYGPYTLEAYQQEFGKLAAKIK